MYGEILQHSFALFIFKENPLCLQNHFLLIQSLLSFLWFLLPSGFICRSSPAVIYLEILTAASFSLSAFMDSLLQPASALTDADRSLLLLLVMTCLPYPDRCRHCRCNGKHFTVLLLKLLQNITAM